MRRVTTAVVLALALSSARTAAQQRPASGRVTVTGVVVDSLTGRPVAAATVSFRSARRVVFTDTLGRFSLEAVSVPAEQVQARQLGYATTTFDTPVRPENPPLLIYLAPDPIPLRAITARAKDDGRYTFEGTVIDSATGRPLPRAVVWFRTSRGTGISDTLGHYLFENARAGFEDIVVDVLGYRRRAAYRAVSVPWQRLDFELVPDPIVLRATAGLMRRLRHEPVTPGPSARYHVYTEQELARSGCHTVRDFLVSLGVAPDPPPVPILAPRWMTPVDTDPASKNSRPYDPETGTIIGGDWRHAAQTFMFSDDPTPGAAARTVMLDGKRVLGGMRGIPNFPLSHFYAVLIPTARGRTLGVYLYTKGFMRMVLRSGAPPSWVNPADTVPEAWRER